MKALPMADLLRRICGEWAARQSIYDIPAELVRRVLDLEAASTGFADLHRSAPRPHHC